MDSILAVLVFGVIFIPWIYYLSRGSGQSQSGPETMLRMKPEGGGDVNIMRRRRAKESFVGKFFTRFDLLKMLEQNMWQAGIYSRVGDVMLMVILLFGIGVAMGAYLWHDKLYSLVMGLAFGWLPIFYIRVRRQRRLNAFSKQLPFALDLVKSSLQAGHSLQRALQGLVSEFDDPLAGEFRTVMEQSRIGLPLPRSLEEMLERVPEDDLRLMVVAVRVQSQVGSSLGELVGRLAEIVRARQRLRLQVRAMTAQARLGGSLVALLPMLVLIAFSVIEPGYTYTLFHDPTGLKIVKGAVIAEGLAFLWIRQLLKVVY
jgi:tight adherence protein B